MKQPEQWPRQLRRRAALALPGVLLLGVAAARAQGPVLVALGGRVEVRATYSITGLAALPAVEVLAAREGGGMSSYVGTLLWPLIVTARPIDGPEPGAHLQHALLARGADGYAVVLAMGEIDPQFEGKPVVIAYKQDGVVLSSPLLVVPGDHTAGRTVRELVSIEVQ